MKYPFFFLISLLNISGGLAQNVGIGTTVPNPSALLEINSTSKGFLPPRMTVVQRDSIQNPAAGLVIWCIDCDELQVFNGTIWKNMSGSAASGFTLPSVKICEVPWMVKNLEVNKYRNGDPIPQVTDPAVWESLTIGAWCWYKNDSATYAALYGKLYNWYAVNDPRGLAPLGWHVCTDAELTTLINCLGSEMVAGGKMKSVTGWGETNLEATNSSGFTALPGGYRDFDGRFDASGSFGSWWTSSGRTGNTAWALYLYNSFASASISYNYKVNGFSVRCVKD